VPTSHNERTARVAVIASTFGVLVALGAMPYSYYMLLRFVLCGVSVFLVFGAGLALVDWQRWLLGASAVLYNPLLPIRLGDKGVWTFLNILTVVLFWLVLPRPRAKQSRGE
jgi:hypothetical protein